MALQPIVLWHHKVCFTDKENPKIEYSFSCCHQVHVSLGLVHDYTEYQMKFIESEGLMEPSMLLVDYTYVNCSRPILELISAEGGLAMQDYTA